MYVCMYVCIYEYAHTHRANYVPQTEASDASRKEAAHGRPRHVVVLDVRRGLGQCHEALKAVIQQVF
jgi:hypothetical protein